jgi:hypothetical protein
MREKFGSKGQKSMVSNEERKENRNVSWHFLQSKQPLMSLSVSTEKTVAGGNARTS